MSEGSASPTAETSLDVYLGGRLRIRQPRRGYRAGVDSLLLAAAAEIEPDAAARVLDLGSGVGVVGLSLALRCPRATVTLVERNPELAALAAENARENDLGGRIAVIAADAAAAAPEHRAAGLLPDTFDHAVANPPYFLEGEGQAARLPQRQDSRAMPAAGLEAWLRTITRLLRPGGRLTMIHRVEALATILAGLQGRFGAVRLLPLQARVGEPATRLLVGAVKASRAPLTLLAPLALHEPDGRYRSAVEACLRAPRGLQW